MKGAERARGARVDRPDRRRHPRTRGGPCPRDLLPQRSARLGREPGRLRAAVLRSVRWDRGFLGAHAVLARRHGARPSDTGPRPRRHRHASRRCRDEARGCRVRSHAAALDGRRVRRGDGGRPHDSVAFPARRGRDPRGRGRAGDHGGRECARLRGDPEAAIAARGRERRAAGRDRGDGRGSGRDHRGFASAARGAGAGRTRRGDRLDGADHAARRGPERSSSLARSTPGRSGRSARW